MQPYFLPYIGYFQLIAAADLFVVYDRIKYTKKGWINRNRLLVNGKDAMFSVPLEKDSDFRNIVERKLAPTFDRRQLLAQLSGAYGHAPQFEPTFALLEQIILHPDDNLFRYVFHSIVTVCAYLGIETAVRISSTVPSDGNLRGQEKVLSICDAVGANFYINPIGGTELYNKRDFVARGIALQFLKSRPFEYMQFGEEFVPWLSIVDCLMFNPVDLIRDRIKHNYELI